MNIIHEIIDEFENFLDGRGVVLDNPEREEADEDDVAIIYGSDYGELYAELEVILNGYGIEV